MIPKSLQWVGVIIFGLIVYLGTGIAIGETPAHAYPEFAAQTNEACSTCHVNPGGGGPRTLRGLLWSAQGRPDQVPELGNILIAPGVMDGVQLYDVACSACHGVSGEGLFGLALVSRGITESKIRTTILRGRERSGMPAFEGQFSEEQLEALVQYVTGIASGEIEPAPLRYPLPPGKLECADVDNAGELCGGN